MKPLLVILFLMCTALGEWKQTDEITLPKGVQVNDLTFTESGELWLLSTSSILKYEAATKAPLLIRSIQGGKLFSVSGEETYLVDNGNRLIVLVQGGEGYATELFFNNPTQIGIAQAGNKPFIIVQEPNRLAIVSDNKVSGSIPNTSERFSTIPSADYGDKETPFYTLANNQLFVWIGGTVRSSESYRKKMIYSASHTILDFVANRNGTLFVLFSDSVIVLESNGEYKTTIDIDKIPGDSRILANPANNSIAVFVPSEKKLMTLSATDRETTSDIITLNNNQPNPVDNYTEIEFSINQPLDLTVTVYNLIGEPVKVIAQGRYTRGTHRIVWHADDSEGNLVPNGIYFYRLESSKGVAIRQLIVLR